MRKLNETTWELSRSFVDGVFAQSEPLGRCTRLYDESGGYRIECVTPGGLFDRMGLQNGDVIQQVNEYSLNNPITIFFAMGALRSAPQLVARILRGNTVRVHTYYVR